MNVVVKNDTSLSQQTRHHRGLHGRYDVRCPMEPCVEKSERAMMMSAKENPVAHMARKIEGFKPNGMDT